MERIIYYKDKPIRIELDVDEASKKMTISEVNLKALFADIAYVLYMEPTKTHNQPVVQMTPEAKPQPSTSTPKKLSPEQIAAMKELKARLMITDNSQLDPFVRQWSMQKLSSYKDLNGDNIDSFIKEMKSI